MLISNEITSKLSGCLSYTTLTRSDWWGKKSYSYFDYVKLVLLWQVRCLAELIYLVLLVLFSYVL